MRVSIIGVQYKDPLDSIPTPLGFSLSLSRASHVTNNSFHCQLPKENPDRSFNFLASNDPMMESILTVEMAYLPLSETLLLQRKSTLFYYPQIHQSALSLSPLFSLFLSLEPQSATNPLPKSITQQSKISFFRQEETKTSRIDFLH